MSNDCSIDCNCSEEYCAVGRAFALGVTMGMNLEVSVGDSE